MKLKIEYTAGWDDTPDKKIPITHEMILAFHDEGDNMILKISKETIGDIIDLANKKGLKVSLENN